MPLGMVNTNLIAVPLIEVGHCLFGYAVLIVVTGGPKTLCSANKLIMMTVVMIYRLHYAQTKAITTRSRNISGIDDDDV